MKPGAFHMSCNASARRPTLEVRNFLPGGRSKLLSVAQTQEAHTMETEKIVEILDELAEQARDEESIFRTAAVDADEKSLTNFSVSCAVACRERAEELEGISILYRTGHKPLRHYFAPLARAWEWLRTCTRERNDMEIIEVCKRHEGAALRAYENALHQPLPGTLRVALGNHLAMIRNCHKGLRQLRRSLWLHAGLGEPVTMQADFHAPGM